MLNWIAWNGTVFDIETVLTLNLISFNMELFWHLTVCKYNLYLYQIELAELGLFELTELLEIELLLTIKFCAHAKLNLKNRTDYLYKMD